MKSINLKTNIEKQKDEYIGIASHELRTPISSLSLYSELLADYVDFKSHKALKIYQDMRSQIKRLVNLVDDLLVVNEIERNKLTLNIKPFNINKFVKDIIHNFKGVTVGHKIIFKSKVKCNVMGDENRLTQVLINLISNSIKYSPSADSIVVTGCGDILYSRRIYSHLACDCYYYGSHKVDTW